jgi:hypothetical protein
MVATQRLRRGKVCSHRVLGKLASRDFLQIDQGSWDAFLTQKLASLQRGIAEPIRTGRCCDRCYWETVVPERVRRMLERDAKREGNGGVLQ